MDLEQIVYISVGALASAWVFLAMFTIYVWSENRTLKKQLDHMGALGTLRIQKVKMKADSNHAYQTPTIAPGEELSRRGFSMYSGHPDIEAQGQNSNPVFVEDLPPPRELSRQSATSAPPFLLHSIETNKRKSLSNPVANERLARKSSSNPNFIY